MFVANLVTPKNSKLCIPTVGLLGLVIFNALPTQVMAQSNPRVNWYEISKNPSGYSGNRTMSHFDNKWRIYFDSRR